MKIDKKTALYIRVSTEAQREEGYSIEAQCKMLEGYCISKNIKNYEFFIDGGYSGSNIDRPEIQRLIKGIEANEISSVVVYKLDRLSRRPCVRFPERKYGYVNSDRQSDARYHVRFCSA